LSRELPLNDPTQISQPPTPSDRQGLDPVESPAFISIAPFYDALMRDVPYRAWVDYLHELLDSRGARPKRALDLACGTGSVAEILHSEGFEVVGVDLSEPMIAEARRKAARKQRRIDYFVQDVASLAIPEPPFDICVSFFDSLNYIIDPAALARAIRRVYAHLAPGGLFVFDINSRYALENGFFDQENLFTTDRLRYVWRSEYDEQTRLCHVHMRFFLRHRDGVDREFRETHVQFAYTEQEIRVLLDEAGFVEVESFHAYTLGPVRETTDRIFFVAQRPAATRASCLT